MKTLAYILIGVASLFSPVELVAQESQEDLQERAYNEIRLFYSDLVNTLSADGGDIDLRNDLRKELENRMSKDVRFMNDFDFALSPSVIKSSSENYITGFLQLMKMQYLDFNGLSVVFEPRDLQLSRVDGKKNNKTYKVSFKNSMRVSEGEEWHYLFTNRQVHFLMELPAKSENNRILEIQYDVPKLSEVGLTNGKEKAKPGRAAANTDMASVNDKLVYEVGMYEGKKPVNDIVFLEYSGTKSYIVKSNYKRIRNGNTIGVEPYIPQVKFQADWGKVGYDDVSRNLDLTVDYNHGRDARYSILYFMDDKGNVLHRINVKQFEADKYIFPSFVKFNDKYENLIDVSYVYQPKVEIGLQFSAYFGRWFGGFEFRGSPAVFSNVKGSLFNVTNIGDSYMHLTGPAVIEDFNDVYDPYDECRVSRGFLAIGGLGGFMLNDVLSLEAGASFVAQYTNRVMDFGYDMASVLQPDGSTKHEYVKSSYSLSFNQEQKAGVGFHLGLNGYIPVDSWGGMIKIGAGYRYSPNFSDYNNFYVSVGYAFETN